MISYTVRNIIKFKLVVIAVCCIFLQQQVFAQKLKREQVLSAYIFNFAKNITWQYEDQITEFHFLIISDDNDINLEMQNMSRSQVINGKPIRVTISSSVIIPKDAHLIFITNGMNDLTEPVFRRIEGQNMLLVSEGVDDKRFIMINFFGTKDETIKFEINKANIINQGLRILPDMVFLGGTEIDVAELYRDSQLSLRTMQEQVNILQQHQSNLENQIEDSKHEISTQREIINSQAISIDGQKTQLGKQRLEQNKLIEEIAQKQKMLSQQKQIILLRENELNNQKNEITRRESVLIVQQRKIDNLNTEIEIQSSSLNKQSTTIINQKKILLLLAIISLLGVSLFFAIFRIYINKRKSNIRLSKEIKDRKIIEDALGKSEDLYYNAPCGYNSLDKDGVIIRINLTELKWIGYKREEVVGKMKFSDLLTEESKNKFHINFSHLKKGGVINDQEFDLIRKDGSILSVLLNATAVTDKDDNFIMSRSNIFDITARKKAEEELEKHREHLEDLVHQRTEELRAAQDELVRNERFAVLGQLTAIVSHELRNPLGTIRNSIYEMNERLNGQNSGLEKALDRAERNIVRCDKIIEELLDYTRETEHITEQLLIDEWIGGFLDEITIPEKIKLVRKLNAGVEVNINPESFRRCLINLIDNAVQAMTETEREVKSKKQSPLPNLLSIETRIEEDNLIISIKDNGQGMSKDELKKIFEPLYSTKGFGVGLGLPIVKKITEQHNGGIEIISKNGEGTIAILRLPLIKNNEE